MRTSKTTINAGEPMTIAEYVHANTDPQPARCLPLADIRRKYEAETGIRLPRLAAIVELSKSGFELGNLRTVTVLLGRQWRPAARYELRDGRVSRV